MMTWLHWPLVWILLGFSGINLPLYLLDTQAESAIMSP